MAAPAANTRGYQLLEVDVTEWKSLRDRLRKFDPVLLKQLRRRLRAAGATAADRIKENLSESSAAEGPDKGDVRALLQMGTKFVVSFAERGGSVKVSTSGKNLPERHQGMARVLNMTTIRHPLFGDKERWFAQPGERYFTEAFEKKFLTEVRREINDALAEAVRALDGR